VSKKPPAQHENVSACGFREADLDTARVHDVFIQLMRAAVSMGISDADIESLKALAAGGDNARFLRQSIAGLTMTYREWLKLDNERHHMRLKFNAFFRDDNESQRAVCVDFEICIVM
jgi:hypothetical protein